MHKNAELISAVETEDHVAECSGKGFKYFVPVHNKKYEKAKDPVCKERGESYFKVLNDPEADTYVRWAVRRAFLIDLSTSQLIDLLLALQEFNLGHDDD